MSISVAERISETYAAERSAFSLVRRCVTARGSHMSRLFEIGLVRRRDGRLLRNILLVHGG